MSASEREMFLRHELVVEEKVDGANLGISFDREARVRCQNRGSYLQHPYEGQWKKLSEWLAPRTDILFEKLADRYILFGEWCYAQHSVFYNRLPDWFLGFDIFDKESLKFLSCSRRDVVLKDAGISGIPIIAKGHFTLSELKGMLSISHLCDKPPEGIYLRFDQEDWLKHRAKLVRPEFIQSVGDHWTRGGIKANQLKPGTQI
jgi:ATP-dependent RNA circularization protein (DNA/RNA ligase family)